MPDWGYLSVEIRPSLVYPEAPWPNIYSLYARIGSEMGLAGLVTWISVWASLLVAVRRRGLAFAVSGGAVPPICIAILMSIVAIFVSGVATDTFRTPMIWITLGAAARFIGAADLRLAASAGDVGATARDARSPALQQG